VEIELSRRRLEDLVKNAIAISRTNNATRGEPLAFHSAVFEKAEMDRIPLDTATSKVVEDGGYTGLLMIKKPEEIVGP